LIKTKYLSGLDALLIDDNSRHSQTSAMQLNIELSALKINQHLFQLAGRIEKSSRLIGLNILYLNVS